MKLNPDCIRDVMIALESETGIECIDGKYFFSGLTANSFLGKSSIKGKHSRQDVIYSLLQLAESGYIFMDYKINLYELEIRRILYITPKGHDFLSNIREDSAWKKIKGISGKISSVSISALVQIASSVMDDFIKHQIGPP